MVCIRAFSLRGFDSAPYINCCTNDILLTNANASHVDTEQIYPKHQTIIKDNLFPSNLSHEAVPLFLRLDSLERPPSLIQSLLGTRIRLLAAISQNIQVLLRQNRGGVRTRLEALEFVFTESLLELFHVAVTHRARVQEAFELALLDDEAFETALRVGFLEEGLFDGSFGCQSVDDDGFCLPDSVRAVLGLEILLGVPVRVVEDYRVGGDEVNALTPCSGAQQEDLVAGVRVEGFDLGLAVCLADGAVNAATVPAAKLGGPILKNVELCFELGEYEDLVPLV